ncbi:MAG: hypothetical protein WAQ27_04035 [Candidatus Microsaccharimonas sp.]
MAEHYRTATSNTFKDEPLFDVNEDGDIVAPDKPDAFGWQREAVSVDHHVTDDTPSDTSTGMLDFTPEASAARSIVGDVVEVTELPSESIDIVAESEAQPKSPHERLFEVQERFGFKPFSKEELSFIIRMTGKDYPQGAATFLNTILLKQRNVLDKHRAKGEEVDDDMPKLSLMSIVGRYGGFAREAGSQKSGLLGLTDMIAERGAKRSEKASSIPVLRDWSLDGSTRAPILNLLKADDIDAFIDKPDSTTPPFDVDYTALSSQQLKQQGDAYIAALRVGQLQDIIAIRSRELTNRKNFWVQSLQEARKHNAARPAAEAQLRNLKIIE